MTPRVRFSDCIFCGERAGSHEHLILAALGGLHTDRSILCAACNSSFSSLDAALAADMRPLNAMIGARNGHTGTAIATEVEDPGTGRRFTLSAACRLDHPEAAVIGEEVHGEVRTVKVLASSQKQVDGFLHAAKAQGKPVRVCSRGVVRGMMADTPIVPWSFGGPQTFRAIARVALNVLAHHYPAEVRATWIEPFKNWIRDGGDETPWVHYTTPPNTESELPNDSFMFQHRFVVGFDSVSGEVYAHISLLGVVDLAVTFGRTIIIDSETVVHDVDVLGQSRPDDHSVLHFEQAALGRPLPRVSNPLPYIQKGLGVVLRKRDDVVWGEDSPQLVKRLNDARLHPAIDLHDNIVSALDGQDQRLLNLAAYVARGVKQAMAPHGPVGSQISELFRLTAQSDSASGPGVTSLTVAVVGMLRFLFADHLFEILQHRDVTADELRNLLEGGLGASIVGEYLWREIEKAHPVFRMPESGED